MTRPLNLTVVMVTLVIIVPSASFVAVHAQGRAGAKVDQKVVDPQAAIKAAAAAFKQAQPIANFNPPKTAWGDPDISGTYLVATYTPLQRPERLKDKPLFTEDDQRARTSYRTGCRGRSQKRPLRLEGVRHGRMAEPDPAVAADLVDRRSSGRSNSSTDRRGAEAAR
jgi:hypothetical protein